MIEQTAPPPTAIVGIAISAIISAIPAYMVTAVAAVALEAQGYSTTAIGVFAMLFALGLVVAAPLAPNLYRLIGLAHVHRLGLVLTLIGTTGFVVSDGFLAWCVFGFLFGSSGAILWGTAETAIARFAPIETLGRTTGIYQTVMVTGLALGPFLPLIFGLETNEAFLVAVVLSVIAWLPLVAFGATGFDSQRESETRSPFAFLVLMRRAPLPFLLGFISGAYEFGISAVTSAEAANQGYDPRVATTVAGVIMIGSMATQLVSGWLADRVATRWIAAMSGVGVLLTSAILAFGGLAHALWGAAFGWGAFGGVMYVVAAVTVGHRFRGPETGTALAGLIVAATLGGLLSPLAAGAAIDLHGFAGLAAFVGLTGVIVVAASIRIGKSG